MKILFFSPLTYGWAGGISLFKEFAKNHHVFAFNPDFHPWDVDHIINNLDYDMALNLTSVLSPGFIKKLRNSVWWFLEYPSWRDFLHVKDCYTHIVVAIPFDGFDEDVKVLPYFADPLLFLPLEKKNIAVFAGTRTEERALLLQPLFNKIKIFGYGWHSPKELINLTFSELAKVYGHTQIVVNHHVTNRGPNIRCFEATMAGATLLTDNVIGIDEHFPEGTIIKYKRCNSLDLKEKLEYYLAHPEEAQEIAKAGRKHALEHHTVEKRVAKLLNIVKG